MIATTRSVVSVSGPVLFVAFELGKKAWKLGITSGVGVAPWIQTVASGDWAAVERAIERSRARFGVSATAAVVSCYEAGRDGFWIHRALSGRGIQNRVVDSASIEVNRRRRRAKTDRIDALKLVPTVAQEAARQVSRERTALTREQTRLINQMRGWLATWGTALPRQRPRGWWTTVRDWAGAVLPGAVQERVARAETRIALVAAQIAVLDGQQQMAVAAAAPASAMQRLVQLKGVATTSASVLLDEGLVWRGFRNRRQVGGFLGFAPVPYASGETAHDQGISRAGNNRVQVTTIQLAWSWVQWQPSSALTQWYRTRFGTGKRARRIGIVALARKLLIALWRYATTGVSPAGAVLKAT